MDIDRIYVVAYPSHLLKRDYTPLLLCCKVGSFGETISFGGALFFVDRTAKKATTAASTAIPAQTKSADCRPALVATFPVLPPACSKAIVRAEETATTIANTRPEPTCKEVLNRPEASPCSSSLTPSVAAMTIVENTGPMPRETTIRPAKSPLRKFQGPEICVSRRIPTTRIASPPTRKGLTPIRVTKRGTILEMRRMIAASGKKAKPV